MFNNNSPLQVFLKLIDFCNYRNYENERQMSDRYVDNSAIVLYDHDCTLCRQEMQRLKSLDHEDRLLLLNINSPIFNAHDRGVSREEVSQALHVLTAEKIWLVGMPAIRHVYAQVGLGWLMAPSGWPLISRLADLAYRYIAPNRYVISHWLGLGKVNGKCTDNVCAVKDVKTKA